MSIPRFLRRPILISRSARQWKRDVRALRAWPSAQLVLNSSPGERPENRFLVAATVPGLWPAGKRAAIGASLVSELHPVTVQAIVEIAQQLSCLPLLDAPAATEPVRSGRDALAKWLLDIASALSNSGLTEEELLYFFTSGAGRARAIGLALRALPSRRSILDVIDSGTGVGMIPWLLTFDFPRCAARGCSSQAGVTFGLCRTFGLPKTLHGSTPS